MREFESGIPQVVFDLADVLPQFAGADLESQLQTFDSFLKILSPLVRPAFAAILRSAASKTADDTSRARIEAAAQSVADGGMAAAPYDHADAMEAYRAQHAVNFGLKAELGPGRKVDEKQYARAIRKANAVKDPTLPRPYKGEAERWLAPDGRVVAWMIVRYFHGEEEYDCYVSS